MLSLIGRLLDVPTTDADDARRRKLLNIVLFGFFVLGILALIAIAIYTTIGFINSQSGSGLFLLIASLIFLVGIGVIYFINIRRSGLVASATFLIFIIILLAFSDTPSEVTSGTTLFFFALPIIMASVLLRSYASFIFAGLATVVVAIVNWSISRPPNFVGILGFLAIALISWLSSRSLEQTLKEVRTINAELDLRVADRTRELSEALTREAEQSGQRQAILQGIADGVVVFDLAGKAILANPALSRLTGIPLDQIISSKASAILETSGISPEERGTLIGAFTHAEASLAPMRMPWGRKTLSVSAAPVLDAKGNFIGNVAVFRDFTREAEVEEMKNSFVAMVSHELRTPLNAILGYSEMLRDAYYGPVNDKQANVSDRILSNSRRLLDIVSDLLDKAQIEAGHLSMVITTVKTAELTENLHSVMDKIARDKGLELYSSIAPEMPETLQADPKRIQQIMINLVNNAAKFTEQGSITVNVYKVAEAFWAFDVVDTGPGIAVEDQKYIFDPFRQVDKTVTRSHGGIGLGLSIVKRLVDLMGGRIFLKSIVGQGSTFTVVLPLEPIQKGKKE
jgi:signal transduction histidine kinase